MPTLNIMVIAEPQAIVVEPGGNVNANPVGAVAANPNGLMQAIALREGSYFDFFQAFDAQLGRDVVLQVLRMKGNAANVLGHLREFLAVALDNFPDQVGNGVMEPRFKILRTTDYMGMPCLVLPYYQQSILQVLNADTAALYSWLADVAEDLSHLHARGLLHGAITPGKILIDGNRAFISGVISYDLQRLLDPDIIPLRSDPTFVAPEALLEDDPERTEAADVFQFGMTMYRVLGGGPPKKFRLYGSARPLREHANGRYGLTMPPHANAEIFNVIQQATAHNRNDRPTMAKLAFALRALAGG